jgi:hypothetical protein
MTVPENPVSIYEQGVRDGTTDRLLDEHDKQLDIIASSIAQIVIEMHEMKQALQRLSDQASSDATTREITAKALKDERESTASALRASRETSDRAWMPWQKLSLMLGGFASAVTSVYYLTHHH